MPYTKYISIVKNKFGKVAVAKAPFPKGHLVRVLRGEDVPEPTRTSIQWGASLAGRSHREDSIGRFINHSCNPTLRVDSALPYLWSIKEIKPNMPLTFNYIKHEDIITSSFICDDCGLPVPRDTACEAYKN